MSISIVKSLSFLSEDVSHQSYGVLHQLPEELILYIFQLLAETHKGREALLQMRQTSCAFSILCEDEKIWKIAACRMNIFAPSWHRYTPGVHFHDRLGVFLYHHLQKLPVRNKKDLFYDDELKVCHKQQAEIDGLKEIISRYKKNNNSACALRYTKILSQRGDLNALRELAEKNFNEGDNETKEKIKNINFNDLIQYFNEIEGLRRNDYFLCRDPLDTFYSLIRDYSKNIKNDHFLYTRLYILHRVGLQRNPQANYYLGLLYKNGFFVEGIPFLSQNINKALYHFHLVINQTVKTRNQDVILAENNSNDEYCLVKRTHLELAKISTSSEREYHLEQVLKGISPRDCHELGILFGQLDTSMEPFFHVPARIKDVGFLYDIDIDGDSYLMVEAKALLNYAVKKGDPRACLSLGKLLIQRSRNLREYEEGLDVLKKGALSGNDCCLLELGCQFFEGPQDFDEDSNDETFDEETRDYQIDTVSQDKNIIRNEYYPKAIEAWESVKDEDFLPEAQCRLAHLYEKKLKDYKKAFECYKKAARGKSRECLFIIHAKYKLAQIYSRDIFNDNDPWKFVKRNHAKAKVLISSVKELRDLYYPTLEKLQHDSLDLDFREIMALWRKLSGSVTGKRKREEVY